MELIAMHETPRNNLYVQLIVGHKTTLRYNFWLEDLTAGALGLCACK